MVACAFHRGLSFAPDKTDELPKETIMTSTPVNRTQWAQTLLAAARALANTQPNATSRRMLGLLESETAALDREKLGGPTDGLASGKSTGLHDLLKDLPGKEVGFSEVHGEIE